METELKRTAVVKKDNMYYLISSGATGWDPNQAKYATAKSMDGPWSALQNFADNIAYDSQPGTYSSTKKMILLR